ncbi:DNA-3-methyladenine glycosylase [Rubrobacter radiotolerans]|nr:DNA-3-methyladenine glycosylase [Rubrobacter radiotolerans]MDX5893975.1 DNA-3-methyladenine glycosylase [Rubrobacter radiotolerans]
MGCTLLHETPEGAAGGVIVETEAYREYDPACHAYNGPTMRNRNLFARPGVAYVYLSYGIHHLINVVCEREGYGSAVLVRALRPSLGTDLMARRRGPKVRVKDLTNGPGKLSRALGVDLALDGTDLTKGPLRLLYGEREEAEGDIVSTTRIGITRGAELPWRYLATGELDVSVKPLRVCERGLERLFGKSDSAR